MSSQDTLFLALRDGLVEFRARIESGDYRDRLLLVAGRDTLALRVARAVLGTVADILEWLHGAMASVESFLTQIDAVLALLAIMGRGLEGLGQALDDPEWPDGLPDPGPAAGAITDLGDALASAGDVEMPAVVPDPATLAAIRDEISALLGARVNPEADPPVGSLDVLIQELQGV
jgi:hypothetical protein